MNVFEFIFPKKCINCKKFGELLCSNCFSKISYNQKFTCPTCLKFSPDGIIHPNCRESLQIDGIVPVVSYGKVVKKLINQFKNAPHLSTLSKTISELMTEGLAQNESFYSYIERYKPVIVPIPLSPKRLRERGYNHSELLGSYVAQYFKLKINTKILKRINDIKQQNKLNKEIGNMEDVFQINKKAEVPESIILVDDITITYSTLKQASKILKKNGAKRVFGVTFTKEG